MAKFGKVDCSKLKAAFGNHVIDLDTVYDPSVYRVIALDNVDSFTMCVEPDEAVKLMLEKQNFELILSCNNYFVYKRRRSV